MNPRDHVIDTNVGAFLRMTRFCEGTADDLGYQRLVGGGEFESFADHPRRLIEIARYKIKSSAAGAYQFLQGTWDEMATLYQLPDFSPQSQDLAAIGLIHRRGALEDVLAGRIEVAITKCNKEWASFHGSPYGQRTVPLARMVQEYRKWGGTLASETAPITESKPTWEAPSMPNPFVLTALSELVQLIPGLIRVFGSEGRVTERNAQAAEAVLQVVQTATGTTNAQAAVEAVRDDLTMRAAATEALDRENWFAPTEAGGGGIAGAREFNLAAADSTVWKLPALWVTLLVMPLVYQVVWAVLFRPDFDNGMKGLVIGVVMTGALGSVLAFWLGSSFGSQKKDASRV